MIIHYITLRYFCTPLKMPSTVVVYDRSISFENLRLSTYSYIIPLKVIYAYTPAIINPMRH